MGPHNSSSNCTASDNDAKLRAAQVIEDESKRMIRQVDELLEHCQEGFSIRAEEQSIRLTAEIEPLMPVVGDIDRLEQVLSNSLDNVPKHNPAGGEVSVIGHNAANNYVEITVADSGPAIPPEQLSMIFERFYQAGEERIGTGLGLAIAREIVLVHDGRIDVSSAPGEGIKFTVRLPTIASDPSV